MNIGNKPTVTRDTLLKDKHFNVSIYFCNNFNIKIQFTLYYLILESTACDDQNSILSNHQFIFNRTVMKNQYCNIKKSYRLQSNRESEKKSNTTRQPSLNNELYI